MITTFPPVAPCRSLVIFFLDIVYIMCLSVHYYPTPLSHYQYNTPSYPALGWGRVLSMKFHIFHLYAIYSKIYTKLIDKFYHFDIINTSCNLCQDLENQTR